jgi:hypothetical protein
MGSPDYISRRLQEGNLTPFKEIYRTIHVLSSHDLINLESAQALFSIGSFDVDDLILNSSGGLIGFIACIYEISRIRNKSDTIIVILRDTGRGGKNEVDHNSNS